MDGLPLFQVYRLKAVHRRAGQEGAENPDGSQQLVNTDRDNRSRAALVVATAEFPLV